MGSTKSTTELHENLDIEKCSASHHVTKVPMKITDYQDASDTEEPVTSGTYRSNQVEVVKKQVADMIEDSTIDDRKKVQDSKNNSNSKSGSFQGILSDNGDIIDNPELLNVPRLSDHGNKQNLIEFKNESDDDDADDTQTIMEEIFPIEKTPPRHKKLAKRLRNRWLKMDKKSRQQQKQQLGGCRENVLEVNSRDHIPQRRLRDTWVTETSSEDNSSDLTIALDSEREGDHSQEEGQGEADSIILFDEESEIDLHKNKKKGQEIIVTGDSKSLLLSKSRKRSSVSSSGVNGEKEGLKRVNTQGHLQFSKPGAPRRGVDSSGREISGFLEGRGSDVSQTSPKAARDGQSSRWWWRSNTGMIVRSNHASSLRKNNSDLHTQGRTCHSAGFTWNSSSDSCSSRFAQTRRWRPGKRMQAPSPQPDTRGSLFPVWQRRHDVTTGEVLGDKCKGRGDTESSGGVGMKGVNQERVCKQDLESSRNRKVTAVDDRCPSVTGVKCHVRCRGRRRVQGRLQDNDVISHYPTVPPPKPVRPMMKLFSNMIKDNNVIGRVGSVSYYNNRNNNSSNYSSSSFSGFQSGNSNNNSNKNDLGLGDGELVGASQIHVDEFAEKEDFDMEDEQHKDVKGKEQESVGYGEGQDIDSSTGETQFGEESGVFNNDTLSGPLAHRPMMRLFKSSFADSNIIGREKSALNRYFNQDKSTGGKGFEEIWEGNLRDEDKSKTPAQEHQSVSEKSSRQFQETREECTGIIATGGEHSQSHRLSKAFPSETGSEHSVEGTQGFKSHRRSKGCGVRRQVISGVAASLNFNPIGARSKVDD